MKPTRLADLRVLLEAACSLALALALFMPFFTVSVKSIVSVTESAYVLDYVPQEPVADLFIAVAALALILSVWRILRSPSRAVVMLLSLVPFVAAGVLVAILQVQWSDVASGWQMIIARLLGAQSSQSFGFWVYLGAAVVGGVLVLTEVISLLIRFSAPVHDPAFVSRAAQQADKRAEDPLMPVSAGAAPETVGSGRVAVVESGQPTSRIVELGKSVILGRDPGCDIRLTDPQVSRRHAVIERVAGGWAVRDLGNTNPSRLMGSDGGSVEIGTGVSITSGQLLVGDALVTLYP